MSGLSLSSVCKKFGQATVLDDISLELKSGELLVLLGPSGCGKSTLLRIIAGLEEADKGEVHIEGRRVDQLRPRERDVALVFQNYSLYPHMTIRKNLAFPLTVAGRPKKEISARVQEVANMLNLGDRLDDRPSQLSGGQRQRVALGRAIIRQPSIFLLDEPLSNLDAELRVKMRQEIVRIQRQVGKTMVHVTHDQTEALTMADRVALLHDGRLEQLGTPEELYSQPASQFVAEFIGQPRINMIAGKIENQRLSPFDLQPTLSLPDKFAIGIRPESITLGSDKTFRGQVTAREYLGNYSVVTIDFRGNALAAIDNSRSAVEIGQEVSFDIDANALLYFDSSTGRRLSN